MIQPNTDIWRSTIPCDPDWLILGDNEDKDKSGFANVEDVRELVFMLPVLLRDDALKLESGDPIPPKFDIWFNPAAASFGLNDPRPPGNIAATAAAAAAAAEVVIVADEDTALFDVYGRFAPSMILLKMLLSKLLFAAVEGGRYLELAYKLWWNPH